MTRQRRLLFTIIFLLAVLGISLAGETCSFTDGDATVAVFCDDGCCDSQCCGDSGLDATAIAIAIAAVMGFLLLIVFVVLLIYCYNRKKGDDVEDEENKRHVKSAFANTTITIAKNNVHPMTRNNFSQTGDPLYANRKDFMPNSRDKVIYGHGMRWNNFNPFPDECKRRPEDEIDDKQCQTDKIKNMSTVKDPSQWVTGLEPNVTVPAPYWRYHKKSTNESQDVYSLMEKKRRTGERERVSRVEEEHELGEYKYEDESAIDMSTGSHNTRTGSISD